MNKLGQRFKASFRANIHGLVRTHEIFLRTPHQSMSVTLSTGEHHISCTCGQVFLDERKGDNQ